MKQLTCEMCGSTDLLKSDGIFVCQSCGCKYSVEEAKKLMVEGTVTVSGSVHADSSHLVTNYFNIARNAYNSGNKAEAEDYCNKIIEVNPGSSEAWLLKGKAAGWQSTLGNIRFAEAINCFANAIQYAAEEKKESLVEECKDEIRNLSEALIRLRGERFQKFPDAAEYAGFSNDVNVIFRAIIQFFTATNVLIDKDTLVSPLSTIINNAVMASWKNVVVPEYANDNEGYPDDYEFERLIERAGYCTKLLELAINLCDTDDVSDIERYQNLIVIHQYMIDACSYQYKTVKVGNSNWDGSAIYENRYVRSKTLTEAAKAERRAQIAKYEAKFMAIRKADIDAKRAKEKKEREDAYNSFWTAHASEKKALTAELAELKNKKLILEKAHTGHKQIQMIEQRITQIEDVLKGSA